MRRTARVTDALRGRKRLVAFVGTAAALLGAGTASAATVASTTGPPAHVQVKLSAAAQDAVNRVATDVSTHHRVRATAATVAVHRAGGRRAEGGEAARRAAAHSESWNSIVTAVAKVSPGIPAAANKLHPVAPSGAQTWMPISGAQLTNARTIVRQAYAKKMGVRSAVIAVATAMQESTLNNINYGTSDSVGLFQQRPSCGWGTVQQIMHPAYAADAFLRALRQHQAGNPGWATQPLWANAQAVQQSAFPFAYAKWEAQAAQLVKQVTTQMR